MASGDYSYAWWRNGEKIENYITGAGNLTKVYIGKCSVSVYRNDQKLFEVSYDDTPIDTSGWSKDWIPKNKFQKHHFKTGKREVDIVFEYIGYWVMYVRMKEPNGVVWEGFGGYGIGGGFENNEYGRDYEKAVQRLKTIFEE